MVETGTNNEGQDTSKTGSPFKGHLFLNLERSSAMYLPDDFRPGEVNNCLCKT